MRIILAMLAMVATLAGCGAQPAPTVLSCPQEDTCEGDWQDGAWWLRISADYSDDGLPGPWVRVSR
jgi:hypothetical protein